LLHVDPNTLEIFPEAWIGFRHTRWLLNPDAGETRPGHTKTHRHAMIVVGRYLCTMECLWITIDLQTVRELGDQHTEFTKFSGEGLQTIGFLHAQIGHVRDTRFTLTESGKHSYGHGGIGQSIEVNGAEGPELCRTGYLQALPTCYCASHAL